jgi:predicted dithiol-disulfide oxidoreductase (DUF899 family)
MDVASVGSRDEWLAARKHLLTREKELTRQRDQLNAERRHLSHLHAADTTLAVVARGPWPTLDRFRTRMGWSVPVYSSFDSDFNYDFHVTLDESIAPVEYNYRTRSEIEERGETWFLEGEQPGTSVFLRDDDRIFHTYSSYARGGDLLLGTYNYLDLTPLGRQLHVSEFPHHDEYES